MVQIIEITNPRIKDLTGKVFGRLTVLGFVGMRPRKIGFVASWQVQCSCGSAPLICISADLNRGSIISCGCRKKEHLQALREDLTGLSFGRLIVIRKSDTQIARKAYKWECLCSCGTTKIISGSSLKQGLTKSCGCLQKEHCKNMAFMMLKKYRASKGFNPDFPIADEMANIRSAAKSIMAITKQRDNFLCVLCNSSRHLHSHHIIPLSQDKLLATDPKNIITLCESCHFNKVHTKGNKGISKKYQQILLGKIKLIYNINC